MTAAVQPDTQPLVREVLLLGYGTHCGCGVVLLPGELRWPDPNGGALCAACHQEGGTR